MLPKRQALELLRDLASSRQRGMCADCGAALDDIDEEHWCDYDERAKNLSRPLIRSLLFGQDQKKRAKGYAVR